MTALPRLTYQLGRSLYIPLTSQCNSIPLPLTRGPGFILSSDVVNVLRNVRYVENNHRRDDDVITMMEGGDAITSTAGDAAGGGGDWIDALDDGDHKKVGLPEYNLPLVTTLYNYNINPHHEMKKKKNGRQHHDNHHSTKTSSATTTTTTTTTTTIEEDSLQPSIAMLVEQLLFQLNNNVNLDFYEVCIAGEGEPTLRMDALLAIARTVQSYNQQQKQQQQQHDENSTRQVNVRLITNGLCYSIPHLGYSNKYNNNNQKTIQLPNLRYRLLRDLIDAGVSRVSVALNTANRHEYDVLMQPACYTGGGMIMTTEEDDDDRNTNGDGGVRHDNNNTDTSSTLYNNNTSSCSLSIQPMMMMPGTAHDLICEFVMDATKLGMDVEITGVDRPGIDKVEMERLARLLLSVGPNQSNNNNQKKGLRQRSGVRWRRYFE